MNAEKYNTPAEVWGCPPKLNNPVVSKNYFVLTCTHMVCFNSVPVFKKLMYHVASFPTVLTLLCLSETGQLLILFLAALLFIKQ